MNEIKLILNRIQTPDGTILTSYSRHDYVTHIDANGFEYMLDGGLDYQRSNLNKTAPYKDLSVYSDAPFEIIRESFHRGGRGKDGKQPLTWVPMSEMSDSWLSACIVYNTERGMGSSFANELYTKELAYRKENGISIDEPDDEIEEHKLYNYIFWFNTFERVWYGIPRDKQLIFFSKNRKIEGVFKDEDINNLINIIKNQK